MLIKNYESLDLSNLLHEALENLNYPKGRINNYVFLIEEALMQWRERLDDESELSFTRTDSRNDAVFTFSVKGEKLDPFAKDVIINYEKPVRTMYDKLLSGIGSELRYKYRKGVNKITLRLPKTDVKDTLFRRTALSFVLPFTLQGLVTSLAANLGVLIVGFLSSEALSGVSFATQIITIHTMLIGAATSAVNSLLSQFWGRRNGSSALFSMWVAVGFSSLVCLLEFIGCFFFPETFLGLYTNIPELIREGANYIKFASIGFLFNSFCCIFYAFLRVTNQGFVATRILSCGCVLNLVLNLLLDFGFFGLPRLGVVGAGIAMAAGILFQFIQCLLYYIKIKPSFFHPNDEINRAHIIKQFVKNALPIFLQYSIWLAGVNFVAAAVGRINADVIAAFSFVSVINTYLFSIKDACGDASNILAGLQLGRNRFEDAKNEHQFLAGLVFKLSLVVMSSLIVIVFISRFLPLKLNDASMQYLFPISVVFFFNGVAAFQNSINNGALHAAGLGRPILIIDSANALLISVPLSLLSIKLNCFAPLLLIYLTKLDEVITYVPKMLNVKRGKWLRNIVE